MRTGSDPDKISVILEIANEHQPQGWCFYPFIRLLQLLQKTMLCCESENPIDILRLRPRPLDDCSKLLMLRVTKIHTLMGTPRKNKERTRTAGAGGSLPRVCAQDKTNGIICKEFMGDVASEQERRSGRCELFGRAGRLLYDERLARAPDVERAQGHESESGAPQDKPNELWMARRTTLDDVYQSTLWHPKIDRAHHTEQE